MSIHNSDLKSERTKEVVISALLLLGAIVFLYPFLMVLINPFKKSMEILYNPYSFPKRIIFDSIREVLFNKTLDILLLYKNSIIVTFTSVVLVIILNPVVSYALAKIKFTGREILFRIMLITMMLPSVMLLIPTYMIMDQLHWVDSYQVMIIPGVLNVLYIFLFRQFISQIPDAFLEAAKIDGANHIGIFTKIIYPMMLPVIATTIVMEATARWNDLFTPLMYLKSEEMFTLQLGLFRFQDNLDMPRLGERWVATALITIPMVLVYIAFQKYFIKAFSSTGLK